MKRLSLILIVKILLFFSHSNADERFPDVKGTTWEIYMDGFWFGSYDNYTISFLKPEIGYASTRNCTLEKFIHLRSKGCYPGVWRMGRKVVG